MCMVKHKVGNSLECIGKERVHEQNINMNVLRSTINKWNFIKLKNIWKTKITVERIKCQSKEWGKIFTNSYLTEV